MLKNFIIELEEEPKGSISFIPKTTNPTYVETPYEPKENRDGSLITHRGCGFGKEETRGGNSSPNGTDEYAE